MKRIKTKDEVLKVALPILQGLLASGHFTFPEPDNSTDSSKIQSNDNGEDWKNDEAFAKRYTSLAVESALDLAHELIDQIELDVDGGP